MKKTMKKMLSGLLLAALLVSLVPCVAAAGYYEPVKVEIPVGGTGTFYLKEAGAEDKDAIDTLKAEGTGTFTLSYDEPDTYVYEIFSKDERNTMRYDVYVYVTTDEANNTNRLSTQIAIYEKGSDRKLPVAYYPITMIDPPVKKKLTGDTPTEAVRFSFTFKAISTTAEQYKGALPMPKEANGKQSMTIEIVGAGEKEIGEIWYDRAGTYIYEIQEVPGSSTAYSYDKSVYRLEVEIVEGEKSLEDIQTVYRDGVKISAQSFEFTNKYTKPVSPKTGDENNIVLWAVLMAAALAAVGVTAFVLIKKGRKNGK